MTLANDPTISLSRALAIAAGESVEAADGGAIVAAPSAAPEPSTDPGRPALGAANLPATGSADGSDTAENENENEDEDDEDDEDDDDDNGDASVSEPLEPGSVMPVQIAHASVEDLLTISVDSDSDTGETSGMTGTTGSGSASDGQDGENGNATDSASTDEDGESSSASTQTQTLTVTGTEPGNAEPADSNPEDSGSADSEPDWNGGNGSDVVTADTDPAEESENTIGEKFKSATANGFEGTVQSNGDVLVEWPVDKTARGYNVYRQAEYITTVFEPSYLDTDTFDGNYYYEIQAFDFADNRFYIAKGLTVKVRGSGRKNPDAPTADTAFLADYELVFEDEFEGDSLDSTKWSTKYLWPSDLIINSEEQYYVDSVNEPDFGFDPFTFDGDSVTINSIPTPPELVDAAAGQPYLSGVMASHGKFAFTYGYAEARAKVPYGKGLWSAFWLLNSAYGGDDPEIDIMEHIGDDQDVVYHTYHYYDGDELRSTESLPVPGIDFTAEYHTYAVDWRPGRIVYYVDGIETHRIEDPRVSSQDMYLIANTALGGWWPGSPDGTTPFPAKYQIDWIRVYQKSTPYNDTPFFNDQESDVPFADNVPGAAPNHRPSFDQWPEGDPTRAR